MSGGGVQVAVRVRPFKKNELDMNAKLCIKMVSLVGDYIRYRTVPRRRCSMIKGKPRTSLLTIVSGLTTATKSVTTAT